MSRIQQTFSRLKAQQRVALIPYVTAGDPDPQLTVPIMHALVSAGADVIELGVPFSDPMADGPAIQRASERALLHGVNLKLVLALVAEFRTINTTTPVVLMGYLNPVAHMGYQVFAEQAKNAGVDGVLLVDNPPEEHIAKVFKPYGLDSIFLVSPTTTEARMQLIASQASGFIYYVSLKGVTGSSSLNLDEVEQRIPLIRAASKDLPVGVGFGIRDAQTASAIGKFADAVVIGSRIVEEIERSSREAVLDNVQSWVAEVRKALDAQI
ncbi:MAG: tryptophan synthase subunit alpha [Betaproteobacteria bacterium]|nr:tryptophan synthase subunit alpha [Betaproteobacteria bacterium]